MKKGLPGTAFMVSCSVILASCSSVDMQHASPPDEALPSVAYRVPKSAEVSENQRVVSASHAASVCRRQLECLAPSFSIIMDYGDSCRGSVSQHMSALAEDMLESGLAVAVSMESRGKKITFTPVYSDCMLMLRAFHEPSFRRTLPPAYQQALNKAVDIVNQVCKLYRSDYERAVALHDYLALHCRYDERAAQQPALLLDRKMRVFPLHRLGSHSRESPSPILRPRKHHRKLQCTRGRSPARRCDVVGLP